MVLVRSMVAGKPKFHLCISLDGCFLFLNSYKRDYPGDIVVPCTDFPYLDATDSGLSVICCSMILRLRPDEVAGGIVKGRAPKSLLLKVFEEAEASEVLSDVDRETIMAGLADWI